MLGVNYPGLSEMFYDGPNVFKTAEGYRRSGEASQNNAQNLADAIQAHQFDTEMNPLRIAHQQGINAQHQLELDLAKKKQPGLLAQAEQIPFDDKNLSALMSHFEGLGDMAVKNGGLPLPIALQLKKSGFPEEILQELSTPQGAQRILDAGKSFRESSMKYRLQGLKNEGAQAVADTKADAAADAIATRERIAREDRLSREAIANKRIDAARKLLQDKRSDAKDKQSLEQYARDLFKQANDVELDDPRAAQILRTRAEQMVQKAAQIRSAPAAVGDQFRREVMGMPTTTNPPAQAAPAATAPASQDNDPLGIRKK